MADDDAREYGEADAEEDVDEVDETARGESEEAGWCLRCDDDVPGSLPKLVVKLPSGAAWYDACDSEDEGVGSKPQPAAATTAADDDSETCCSLRAADRSEEVEAVCMTARGAWLVGEDAAVCVPAGRASGLTVERASEAERRSPGRASQETGVPFYYSVYADGVLDQRREAERGEGDGSNSGERVRGDLEGREETRERAGLGLLLRTGERQARAKSG